MADDDLRTRIAAALYCHAAQSVATGVPWLNWEDAFPVVREVWLSMADAVIAELQPELNSLDRLTQWQAAPRLPMHYLMPDGSDPGFVEWKADDE
jgi:hypothetical protein